MKLSKGPGKIDLFLIVVSAIGVACASVYLFVSKPDTRVVSTNENLGYIKPHGADIRLRGEKDAGWSAVTNDANVYQNDRVFTGAKSTAVVKLKSKQQFTVEPQSLIKITDDTDTTIFDVDSGSFLGELKKGARVLIRGRDKTTTELKSEGSTVRLESTDDTIKLVVLEGEATIQKQGAEALKVSANQEAEIKKDQDIKVVQFFLRPELPRPGNTVWKNEGEQVTFRWEISEPTEVMIEISEDPSFKASVFSQVTRDNQISAPLKSRQTYFWRLQSNGKIASVASSFSVEAKLPPVLPQNRLFISKTNWRGVATEDFRLAWEEPSQSESYFVEVSESEDFASTLVKETTDVSHLVLNRIRPGVYFWRVTSHHEGREALVSAFAKFEIQKKIVEPLAESDLERSLANQERPGTELLPQPSRPENEVAVLEKTAAPPLLKPIWAEESYQFELSEPGLDTSDFSEHYTRIQNPKVSWTPVDGVEKYIVELSSFKDFTEVKDSLTTDEPNITFEKLYAGQYYIRVQGVRGNEKVISNIISLRTLFSPPKVQALEKIITPNESATLKVVLNTHSRAVRNEVQISNDATFTHADTKVTEVASVEIPLVEPGRKYVRARSMTRGGWRTSKFSKVSIIDVPSWDALEAQPSQVTPLARQQTAPVKALRPRFNIYGGLGANYLTFTQTSDSGLVNGTFKKLAVPTYTLGGAFNLSDRLALAFEYNERPGEIRLDPSSTSTIDKTKYTWRTLGIETQYEVHNDERTSYALLLGTQLHHVPFIHADGITTNLKENELTTLAAGIKINHLTVDNFDYELQLRYQSLLGARSLAGGETKMGSSLIYDGLIGVNKRFGNGAYLGISWFGQQHNYKYEYSVNGTSSNGSQGFFNSTFQFRIGATFFGMLILPIFRRRKRN